MNENNNGNRIIAINNYLKELVALKKKIDFYNYVFCNSDNVDKIKPRRDLEFISLIQSSINDSVLAGVARLFLDNKFQNPNKKKGQTRLCLDYFIEEYQGEKYEQLLLKIKDFIDKYEVKKYRNSYLSHSDFEVKMGYQRNPHGMDENSLSLLLEITINSFVGLLAKEMGNSNFWPTDNCTFHEFPRQFLDKLNL